MQAWIADCYTDLPSSDTSVSRFIRGVYYTTYAPQATSAHDAMNTLAHIMSRFRSSWKNITVGLYGEEGEGNATRKTGLRIYGLDNAV